MSIDTAQAEFDTALQRFRAAQNAYHQAQETLQRLQERKADLQAKGQQYEADAEAAEQEFKALFAKHGFTTTPEVKSAMHQKMANKDMATETASALTECQRAIDDLPFQDDIASLVNTYAATRAAVREKYAALMLARALSEVPESLLKAIALHQYLAGLNDIDFKGAVLLPSDRQTTMATALRPIFEAMEGMAQRVNIHGELEAAGITTSTVDVLPAIAHKTPAQRLMHQQKNLSPLHSQR
nr:hypothetical protein [Comamonas sp. NoAH]